MQQSDKVTRSTNIMKTFTFLLASVITHCASASLPDVQIQVHGIRARTPFAITVDEIHFASAPSPSPFVLAFGKILPGVVDLVKHAVDAFINEPSPPGRAKVKRLKGISPVISVVPPIPASFPAVATAIHSPCPRDANFNPQSFVHEYAFVPASTVVTVAIPSPAATPIFVSSAEHLHPVQPVRPIYPTCNVRDFNPLQLESCGLEKPVVAYNVCRFDEKNPLFLTNQCGLEPHVIWIDLDKLGQLAMELMFSMIPPPVEKPILVNSSLNFNIVNFPIVASPGPLYGFVFFDAQEFADEDIVVVVPRRFRARVATILALAVVGVFLGILGDGEAVAVAVAVEIGVSISDTLAKQVRDFIEFLESSEIHAVAPTSPAFSDLGSGSGRRVTAVVAPGVTGAPKTVRTSLKSLSVVPPCLFVGGRRRDRKSPTKLKPKPVRPSAHC
ncbi:hypothetical protein H0H81_010791 [Sphagnurus paluster]|uniref:Transmembrane protein n=1 Tax=Sphagnurus paluster TaxID=117069 RepID=A0A9P7FYP4_9AGAR|nr:hypothetical protein H0H81_010791 [Sphagnurus paluster]